MTYEGGGAIRPANGQQGLLVYFGSNDIDASVARVRELGGEASDNQEIPGIASAPTAPTAKATHSASTKQPHKHDIASTPSA